jgi:hypothetical protein
MPETAPKNRNGYGILLRSAGYHPYCFGTSYAPDQKYQAQLLDKTETFIILKSHYIEPGKWHHVAMVVDDDAKKLHLYIDGQPVKGSPRPYFGEPYNLDEDAGTNYSDGEYYIGSSKPDNGVGAYFTRHFRGMIDDVRIYNRALSASEIHHLFAQSD